MWRKRIGEFTAEARRKQRKKIDNLYELRVSVVKIDPNIAPRRLEVAKERVFSLGNIPNSVYSGVSVVKIDLKNSPNRPVSEPALLKRSF